MTREEGVSAWARGIAPNTVRAILMNMSQLARSVRAILPLLDYTVFWGTVLIRYSYDWIKSELIKTKLMEDGPALHFVASIGAVSSLSSHGSRMWSCINVRWAQS